MLSPKSGKLTEPASLCSGEKVSAVVSFLYMLLLVGGGAWGYVKGGGEVDSGGGAYLILEICG